MHLFDSSATERAILLYIRGWVTLLAEQAFEEACNSLDIPVDDEDYVCWTPELLKKQFVDYTWGERFPVIENPHTMDLTGEQVEFYAYDMNSRSGYAVDYTLPLDGEWSDLTAQFSFIKTTEQLYSIHLEDIHVL